MTISKTSVIVRAREAVRQHMIARGWEDLAETHSAVEASDAAMRVLLEEAAFVRAHHSNLSFGVWLDDVRKDLGNE